MQEADEGRPPTKTGRPRRGVRSAEAVVFAVAVGVACYAAGVRNGMRTEKRRAERRQAADPAQGHGEQPPGGSGMPSMSVEALRERLAGFSHQELVAIANQHLDQAKAASDKADSEGSQRRFMIAVAAYEQALEQQPQDPNVLTDLGIALRGLGDSAGAVQRFREAAQQDPKHLQSRFNLGLVLLEDMNHKDQAIAAWEDYLRVAPKTGKLRPMVEKELAKLRGGA